MNQPFTLPGIPSDLLTSDRITLPIVRGDYLVVTCTATTATADCVIEWGESI